MRIYPKFPASCIIKCLGSNKIKSHWFSWCLEDKAIEIFPVPLQNVPMVNSWFLVLLHRMHFKKGLEYFLDQETITYRPPFFLDYRWTGSIRLWSQCQQWCHHMTKTSKLDLASIIHVQKIGWCSQIWVCSSNAKKHEPEEEFSA